MGPSPGMASVRSSNSGALITGQLGRLMNYAFFEKQVYINTVFCECCQYANALLPSFSANAGKYSATAQLFPANLKWY